MILALLIAAAASTNPPIAPLRGDPLSKGSVGFQFGFPLGGGTPVGSGSTVGLTWLLNDNVAARADFGLDGILSTGGGPASFSFGVALRFYQIRRGPVAVFFWPGLTFARHVINIPGPTGVQVISIAGGAGAEYFFAEHFSVGGQLGIGLSFDNLGGPAGTSVITQITTATSGLFASVYF